MKTKLFSLAFLLIVQTIFCQNILGTWYGNLDIQGQKLPLLVHIEKDGSNFKSTFDSPMQGAKGIPIQNTTFANNELNLDASNMGITFKGNFNGEIIDGNFSQNGMNLPLVLSRKNNTAEVKRPQEPKEPFPYINKEVKFKNDTEGNLLAGTLASPKNFKKNSPVLVMITGSGAQNRDEELFGHKPFLVISDDLAKKGIATLRLDDRGIAESEKGKDGATTADFATDINSAVNYLVKKGYHNIGLIGHSEGGMIAPMVADENKNVKFIVLLAAPGIPISDLIFHQVQTLMVLSKFPADKMKEEMATKTKLFGFAKKYKGNNFKTDLEDYLNTKFKDMPEKDKAIITRETSTEWFQYFLKFEPADYLSKIKIPVLALNGSLDAQVNAKENLTGIKNSLTTAGNKKFEILEMEGLNHLFQTAKTGNPTEYGQIEETIAPKVLDTMSNWILALK